MFQIATLVILVGGCGRTDIRPIPVLVHFDYEPPATGGTGGTTTTGGTGGDVDPICDPKDVFVGSDGCYLPEQLCCNVIGADLEAHCDAATNGARPVPYLCAEVPLLGEEETDYRDCIQLSETSIGCLWGTSALLCCEVP